MCMLMYQVQGQSSVGVTDSTFLGNVNANSQGGALAVGPGGLVQVLISPSTLPLNLQNGCCRPADVSSVSANVY